VGPTPRDHFGTPAAHHARLSAFFLPSGSPARSL